jgi:translation initiation factor 2 subunit 3
MVKEIPELNIGIFGHIDNGKTTLLKGLTGKFADTHSEELKRGITIKLGYSNVTLFEDNGILNTKKGEPKRYISFIDAPGHEMLMATMLSGASIIDGAILVIAANENFPQAQTKEHFMALQAKGIKNIIVIQNKIDLISKEKAIENYEQIKTFLKGSFAENSPIIPISAQQEINLDKIFEELYKMEIPKRDINSNPIFLIARSFDINKPGKKIEDLNGGILGGVLKKGQLKVNDEIEIKPGLAKKNKNKIEYQTINTKIISIQKGNEKIKEVNPGASISIETELDPYLTKTDSLNGCVLSKKGVLPKISDKITLEINLFKNLSTKKEFAEELKTKEIIMLSINTTITIGTIEKIKDNQAQINLNTPVLAIKDNKIGIAKNINNHWRLIGWGKVL